MAYQWIGEADRNARQRRIASLDPKTDFMEISSLFYGDFRSVMISLPFAGFMTTFASPRMSRILSKTGELEYRFAKRAVDTSLFAKMVHMHGLGSELGREAARKVNAIHSRYDIHEEDFILVGCDPCLYSIEIAETYGWRPVMDAERDALRLFYDRQARAFGSRRPLPKTIPEMKHFVSAYFDAHLGFEPQNLKMAKIALAWYSNLAPRVLRPVVRRILPALLDIRVARACGLPEPTWVDRRLTRTIMAVLSRRDPVPDGAPDPLEALAKTIYPDGWDLAKIGPAGIREADIEAANAQITA